MLVEKESDVGKVEVKNPAEPTRLAGNLQIPTGVVDDSGVVAERLRIRAGATRFQRSARILLVVDDPDFGDWLLDEFKYVGCAVALATRGAEGLPLIRSGLVDVVISEMGLPDLPGLDLLRALRGMSKSPKVILTTNRHSDFLAARAMEDGASAVLSKPFPMEDLLSAITRSLAN